MKQMTINANDYDTTLEAARATWQEGRYRIDVVTVLDFNGAFHYSMICSSGSPYAFRLEPVGNEDTDAIIWLPK